VDRLLVAKTLHEKSCAIGAHLDALDAIDRINAAGGNASHTSQRFRRELLYWLLDNPSRGPIIEVGTMYGGMTSQFGYLAAVTGRECYAVDIDAPRLKRTRSTCAEVGVNSHVVFCDGDLVMFLDQRGSTIERPDLLFIDSSHDYNTTLTELRALHGRPNTIPRTLALHDYNYRHAEQSTWFDDIERKNPIAIDIACRQFFSKEFSGAPLFKRCGGLSGDGLTPNNPPPVRGDYVDLYGSEGMMVFYP
jgi:hypothetical protein